MEKIPLGIERKKIEAIKQWSNDPCGAHYAEKCRLGSDRFFYECIKYRYGNYAPWLKQLINSIDVQGKTVLEIGCGMGIDLLELTNMGGETIGLDLVNEHLKLAKVLFSLHNKPTSLFRGDAEQLPLASESIDVVYSFGVLHHTPNIHKAIDEIYRVLKQNGRVIIGRYHKNSWYYWVNLIFLKGILQRGLKGESLSEFLSTNVEFSRSDAKPLVKVYSRSDCRKLFKRFSKNIKVKTYHFKKEQIPIPNSIKQFLPPFPPLLDGTCSSLRENNVWNSWGIQL
jgi:ubiquinone/menaquinone biosynthesis C-methylase UbiE